ncbi:MAG: adenosylcobinamide-GDP ribazoletransferase [Lautropia sp.]|nr:adenosylcobinamide-GDP ribazoletransferase [Lautropia sp.]
MDSYRKRPGNGLRHFLLALQFFTCLPMPARMAAWVGFDPVMMKAAAGHFPGVGWLVGLVAAGALGVASMLLGTANPATMVAVVVLSIVATVGFTGAFHEDGLADVGDALGGFAPPEKALQIMKDSRLGSYGTLTLVLALLLKICLLTALLPLGLWPTVAASLSAHVLSRWAPLWLIRWLRYVGSTRLIGKNDLPATRAHTDTSPGGCAGNGSNGNDITGTTVSTCCGGAGGRAGAGPRIRRASAGADLGQEKSAHTDTAQEVVADASKSRGLAEDISRGALTTALLWVLPAWLLVGLVFGWATMLLVLAIGSMLTWRLGLFFLRRIGGVTGDCLGATQQLNELACYLVLVVCTGVGH